MMRAYDVLVASYQVRNRRTYLITDEKLAEISIYVQQIAGFFAEHSCNTFHGTPWIWDCLLHLANAYEAPARHDDENQNWRVQS